MIYGADELPALVEKDAHGEIGGVRELTRDYIENVRNGIIYPECDGNWRITGRE